MSSKQPPATKVFHEKNIEIGTAVDEHVRDITSDAVVTQRATVLIQGSLVGLEKFLTDGDLRLLFIFNINQTDVAMQSVRTGIDLLLEHDAVALAPRHRRRPGLRGSGGSSRSGCQQSQIKRLIKSIPLGEDEFLFVSVL